MKILSFGEILFDVYPTKRTIGGAPMNFAAHTTRHGDESFMLSSVGDDELGREAIKYLKSFGISTEYTGISNDKPTGVCNVTLDDKLVPSYDLAEDTAYDFINTDKVIGEFDVLYFGTLALRSKYDLDSLGKLISRMYFREIFVDVNLRAPFYSRHTARFALEHATILKVSAEEADTLCELLGLEHSGEPAKLAHMLFGEYSGLRLVIITLGEHGAIARKRGGKCHYCASVDATVVSTVGAGDSFSAAFLHKYMRTSDIPAALEHANRVAGYVVAHYEAVPEYDMSIFEHDGAITSHT